MAPYLEQMIATLKELEGCVPWMYRDTSGKVTAWVGLMLPNAEAACGLPFMLAGKPASEDQIAAEFARVAALEPGKRPGFYRSAKSPELEQAFMDERLGSVLARLDETLQAKITGYVRLPDAVKAALLDMAYNLGVSGLLEKYPRMLAAIATGSWADAAAECVRHGVSEERNAWTRRQLLNGVVDAIRAEVGARVAAEAELLRSGRLKGTSRKRRHAQ